MGQNGGPAGSEPAPAIRRRSIHRLFIDSFDGFQRHNGPRLGAALSFYALLSLTPLVLIAVSIGGLVYGQKAAEGQLFYQIQDLAGAQGALAIQAMLRSAHDATHGVLATVVGMVTLFFGASAVLIELRESLNSVWDMPTRRTTPWQGMIQLLTERLFSFVLVLAIGFLLLISLLVNTGVTALGAWFHGWPHISALILHALNFLLSLLSATILFAAVFKTVPDARLRWRDAIAGAAVTSLLFTLSKFLLGVYLSMATIASTYGAAASFILFMVWCYYSAQIFFFGAEFTRAFAGIDGPRTSAAPTKRQPGR